MKRVRRCDLLGDPIVLHGSFDSGRLSVEYEPAEKDGGQGEGCALSHQFDRLAAAKKFAISSLAPWDSSKVTGRPPLLHSSKPRMADWVRRRLTPNLCLLSGPDA